MGTEQKLAVDVVSDVVCPWCFLGQKRLEQAMQRVPEVEFDVHWRPYQLDPTVPAEGLDRESYMVAKFGSREKIDDIHEKLGELGRLEGIVFNFADISKAPNTIDAHRVIRWAASADGPNPQHALTRRLFELYFQEGADIGDRQVLIGAADEVGMDAALVEALLPTDADRAEVEAEIETARQMGVTGVPCFLIERQYAVIGAQDAASLADAFRQIADRKASDEAEL